MTYVERLYEITLNEKIFSDLNIKIFETADLEWLDFILMCRENGGMPHNYDLVIGPTADDDTALCLKVYWGWTLWESRFKCCKNNFT